MSSQEVPEPQSMSVWLHLVAEPAHDSPSPLTCLTRRGGLLEELADRKLLLEPALLILGPGAGRLLRGGGPERGRHLLVAQGFPLTLLRHLQSELVVRPVVARAHISVADHSGE